VAASGTTAGVKILADTLVAIQGDSSQAGRIRGLAVKAFGALRFPRAARGSLITLPLLFR